MTRMLYLELCALFLRVGFLDAGSSDLSKDCKISTSANLPSRSLCRMSCCSSTCGQPLSISVAAGLMPMCRKPCRYSFLQVRSDGSVVRSTTPLPFLCTRLPGLRFSKYLLMLSWLVGLGFLLCHLHRDRRRYWL